MSITHHSSKRTTLNNGPRSVPSRLNQEAPVNAPNKSKPHQLNPPVLWKRINDHPFILRQQIQKLNQNRIYQLTSIVLLRNQSRLKRPRKPNLRLRTRNRNHLHRPRLCPARRTHQKTTWRPITMAIMQRPSQRRVANHRAPTPTQSDPLRSIVPPAQHCHRTCPPPPHPTNTAAPRTRPSHRLPPLQQQPPPSLISTK